jgi:hypothetical protein
MARTCWLLLIGMLSVAVVHAQPTAVVDDMENLSGWRTGGQKEASLVPERTLVKEGRQALRFEVRIDHSGGETIDGQKYPQGLAARRTQFRSPS